MNDMDIMVQDQYIRMQLKKIRKSSNMSQKELSDITGLSTSTISAIEKIDFDSPSYNIKSLITYATALGYELELTKIKGVTNIEETKRAIEDVLAKQSD